MAVGLHTTGIGVQAGGVPLRAVLAAGQILSYFQNFSFVHEDIPGEGTHMGICVGSGMDDCISDTEHVFFVLKEQFEERIGEIFSKAFHQLSQTREKLVYSVIGGKEVSLAPADILYFERSGRTTNIITVYGTYPIWDKLSALTERLPKLDFVRCHNSYIVYLPAVREMLADVFLMDDGREVMISRSYRKIAKAAFMKWAVTQMS